MENEYINKLLNDNGLTLKAYKIPDIKEYFSDHNNTQYFSDHEYGAILILKSYDDKKFYGFDHYNLLYTSFPYNCGITVFCSLSRNANIFRETNDLEKEKIMDILIKSMNELAKEESTYMMMYTTSDEQFILENALENNDWTRVSSTHNGNSGNEITVWTKVVNYDD